MSKSKYMFSLALGFMFTVLMLLKEAGNFLVINEKPVTSDVIIMLSGGEIERLEKSVELYKMGYAPFIIISNGKEDNLYQAAQDMGIPSNSLLLEKDANSTKENALFTKSLMKKHQFKSAIVVSSNYHMRRVKNNFTQVFADTDIRRLTYCSIPDNGYNPDQWWKTEEERQTTYMEYVKLIGNYFGIHGNEAKETLNKIR